MQLTALTEIKKYDFGIKALPHGPGNVTSLETLLLVSCKGLQHLDFLDAMPKLWDLRIVYCPLLESLSDGLVNLVSLEVLTLSNCEKLQHLPSGDAMRRLTKLRYLRISGCPHLGESCPNEWSKISHIPSIDWADSGSTDWLCSTERNHELRFSGSFAG
ncbi:PREDICTED: disease resistance protein RGA2-like [Nicotiana attenuata]|uniref:Disease resistance protein rga2 n=1 Tax=Nicotiana attenuata TaxID=49451 RepID=A0A314L3A0_NICAT|nr:PREDICTED: disease resistance protein RGA2-like [Nicotiana attenuata]OIT35489.1 disease resistance protein rga2 [Nicotiana attenuata]